MMMLSVAAGAAASAIIQCGNGYSTVHRMTGLKTGRAPSGW